ncbi:MAG: hypothetical protein WA919_18925 [Coleofasciculaceae cyanobacterium]
MRLRIFVLTTAIATLGFTFPVTAQSRNSSQHFFGQGWERLEREIEILQKECPDSEELTPETDSVSSLEIDPCPTSQHNQEKQPVENPSQQPLPEEQTNSQQEED